MTTANERRARLLELSAQPRRGVRRFSPEQEAEILALVDDPADFSHTDIARVFANDPTDAKEVKNISLVIGNIVKRRNKALDRQEQETEAEEGDEGGPTRVVSSYRPARP